MLFMCRISKARIKTHANNILYSRFRASRLYINNIQQDAGIYLLQVYSTCFGCPLHPSLGVHKFVTAASGTGHSIWATNLLQRGQIRPSWRKVVALLLWPVPEAAVTVLCTPDDVCDGHPKHVQSNFAYGCILLDLNNTHTLIFTAFPQLHWLPERASMLRFTYISCLVLNYLLLQTCEFRYFWLNYSNCLSSNCWMLSIMRHPLALVYKATYVRWRVWQWGSV